MGNIEKLEDFKLNEKNLIEKELLELAKENEKLNNYKEALYYYNELYKNFSNKKYYFSIISTKFKIANTKKEMLELLADIDRFLVNLDDSFEYKHGVYCNRGILLTKLGLYNLAKRDLEKTLKLKPDFYIAEKALGLLNLLLGNYSEGWKQYQARWKAGHENEYAKIPQWSLDVNTNGKVFIYTEQGVGDNIHFFRYILLLKLKGVNIIVQNNSFINELLNYNLSLYDIESVEKGAITIEYQASVMDLPYIFSTTLENIPFKKGYLQNIPEKKEKWNKKIGKKEKMKIGFFCKSYSYSTNAAVRNIPIEIFSKLFSADAEFHFLQKDIEVEDRKMLENYSNVYIWDKEIESFSDTGAIIEEMDLIITVDTAVAHLAGALGKNVWVLLTYDPDFRWLLDRNDSVWYESMYLFRQKEIGEWDYVVNEVLEKLLVEIEIKNKEIVIEKRKKQDKFDIFCQSLSFLSENS